MFRVFLISLGIEDSFDLFECTRVINIGFIFVEFVVYIDRLYLEGCIVFVYIFI